VILRLAKGPGVSRRERKKVEMLFAHLKRIPSARSGFTESRGFACSTRGTGRGKICIWKVGTITGIEQLRR
jgi:hypothetical protein